MLSRKAGVSPHPQGDTGGVFSQGLLLPCESSRVRRPRPPKPLERHRRSAPCPSASRASTSRVPLPFQATMNARPQRILTASSLTQSAPASPTNKGVHIHQAG